MKNLLLSLLLLNTDKRLTVSAEAVTIIKIVGHNQSKYNYNPFYIQEGLISNRPFFKTCDGLYIYYFNGIYSNSTNRVIARWCFHDSRDFNGGCSGGFLYSVTNYNYQYDFAQSWLGWGKSLGNY